MTVGADAVEESCNTRAAMASIEGESCFPDLSKEDDVAGFELRCCDNNVLKGGASANMRVVD